MSVDNSNQDLNDSKSNSPLNKKEDRTNGELELDNDENTQDSLSESFKSDDQNETKNPNEQDVPPEEDSKETLEANLSKLHNDINYGVILAFIEKFGANLYFKEINFNTFESYFINTKTRNY